MSNYIRMTAKYRVTFRVLLAIWIVSSLSGVIGLVFPPLRFVARGMYEMAFLPAAKSIITGPYADQDQAILAAGAMSVVFVVIPAVVLYFMHNIWVKRDA